ncbi:glycosyltransferase [uncultured Methanolobus sp.]|uniref:CgeB family protein n=1 Tax=uncultured Methanolobus sp. TaxID=218300 RepID=UPI002AAAEB88|nr:glycosyltransferase [uncultured Methanolobus sp.]
MKIVPVFLRYDYGQKSRGESLDVQGFYPAFKRICDEVYPFWFDEYLGEKEKLQEKLIEFIDNVKPDIVFFILMKNEFTFETLDYLKSKYTTINWFCDDQWRFDTFTKNFAPHFAYSITTDKFSLEKYKGIGYENVISSQWASFGATEGIDIDGIEYKYDVSFVGGISGHRKWIIDELSKKGIHVECFGYGWKNGKVSFEEMKDIFRTSRINLNISNSVSYDIRCMFSSLMNLREFVRSRKTTEQIKARNFEIPAFGGFQLTNYVPSIEDYFDVGREIACYTTVDDVVTQISYFLGNEEKRREILETSYKKAINNYTYYHLLKRLFLEEGEFN